MRRMLAATVTAAALACSGSAVGAQEDPGGGSFVDTIIENADESLGEQTTIALLRSIDRGYDLVQIIEGLLESSVAPDGTISDDEGVVVPPTNAAAGVIAEDAAGSSGPAGGAVRHAGPTSGEAIALDALERGIDKTTKRLDKKDDLSSRAAVYESELDVIQGLMVLVLISEGYSVERIILDGFMAGGLIQDYEHGGLAIKDENGKRLRPDGDKPTYEDVDTATAVDNVVDGIIDALSGEDPLAAADDSFKRQYTLTIDIDITGDGATGTIEGKANFGARKDEAGALSGRGNGTLNVKGACSLSELDTTEYPYTVSAPLRIGVAGQEDGGKAKLGIAVAATSDVQVTGDEDALCMSVVRDTANAYPQLISIPEVEVRLRDGAKANADNQDSGQAFTVGVAVQVKEI